MTNFSETYPNIAKWTKSYGWIEIGQDDYSKSFIRVLDIGGMLWESKPEYKTLDEALDDLEKALEKIIDTKVRISIIKREAQHQSMRKPRPIKTHVAGAIHKKPI